MESPPVYLSVAAIYRDEAPYLAEWIEFHKLVGVERFFLYNNLSSDDHREVLAPDVADGTVVVEDWPGESPEFPGQAACNFHCVQQHRDEARWVAFIDVDEFLFSPTGRPVPEMLKEFEYAAALWVTRLGFGSSGHETKPDGPVIESYVRRSDDPVVNGKRLVDPKRVVQAGNVASEHAYTGPRVNTNHDPVERPRFPRLLDKLRINHYYTKSAEEARAKGQRIRPNDGKPQIALQRRLDAVLAGLDIATDTTIHMYLPQLREALERRKQGTVTS